MDARRATPPANTSPALDGRTARGHAPRSRPTSAFLSRLRAPAVLGLVLLVVCVSSAAARPKPKKANGGAQARKPPPASAADLTGRLDTILAALPKATQAGLMVVDADSGDEWYSHDGAKPLKPASVQKLLVTAAALERFGPQFQYKTGIYLRGDELWVVGAGDPGLGDERLADRHGEEIDACFDEWAAALKARGVTRLSRVVLDDSVFERPGRHSDWPADQAETWYQAPVGGLNLNDNCLDVTVQVRNRKIELELQPDLPLSLIHNQLTVANQQRIVLKRAQDQESFLLSGSVTHGTTAEPISVGQPTAFFGHALQKALETRGIKVANGWIRGQFSADEAAGATPVATHLTDLPDVLWRANTFSQNLFAECLLKSLAAYEPGGQRSGTAGSWKAGEQTLRQTLGQLGLDLSGAVIRDGSGLSHQNRVTAAQLTKLLQLMRRHGQAQVFLETLARPGEPGSMEKRFADPVLKGRVHAKTGTLASVRGLAGYVTRPDGKTLVFALLLNGGASPEVPVQVCKALVEAPRGQ